MAVEILTVSLSPETIDELAKRVAYLIQSGNHTTTQSNPPSAQTPQPAEAPASAPQADPWLNSAPQPQQAAPQAFAGGQSAPQQYPVPAPQPHATQAPTCAHGPMRYVAAGTAQTGRQYAAFWGCPRPKGS